MSGIARLTSNGGVLTAVGMVRQAKPAGFCPACRLFLSARDARPELARPMLAALVVPGPSPGWEP